MTAQLERHLLSVAWGDMPENDFREFVESVREHGVADPLIVLLDGKVLDGWHRYRAAVEVGIELELVCREFLGDDPVGQVIRRNGDRRHLTPGQRAACVVACYEWAERGRPGKSEPGSYFPSPVTEQEMAAAAGTSTKTIQQAKVAQEGGLSEQTRSGELSPKAAAAKVLGVPEKPKGPTRTEKLEALVDALKMEIEEKAARIEELEQRLAFMERESSPVEAVREEMFNRYREQIRVLKGSVGEWQTKYNDVLTENKGLRAVLKRVGGNVKETPRQEAIAPGPVYQAPADGHHSREMEPEEVDTFEYVDDPDGWEAESREDIGGDLAADVGTYEASQWLDGFRVGAYVVTDQGEQGFIQDIQDDRLLVRLGNGLGELVAMESEQVSHEDKNAGH